MITENLKRVKYFFCGFNLKVKIKTIQENRKFVNTNINEKVPVKHEYLNIFIKNYLQNNRYSRTKKVFK